MLNGLVNISSVTPSGLRWLVYDVLSIILSSLRDFGWLVLIYVMIFG